MVSLSRHAAVMSSDRASIPGRIKMRCETAEVLADGRIVSPSAERNKGPIAEILMRVLPAQGEVLEVSSGTGQHVLYFAEVMPHIRWQPTERDANSLKSIASWLRQTSPPNVNAPLRLDVHDASWPAHDVAAVVCINMIHIAPAVGCRGLAARRRQCRCSQRHIVSLRPISSARTAHLTQQRSLRRATQG